ncbi:MAG TPA: plastocyanin/azurin family copper-binding protein [Steroidobacteraceae bacterium]|nr:plastocyanin/azurin family copper-binding protein [Steroidobacteraceae bacterium]
MKQITLALGLVAMLAAAATSADAPVTVNQKGLQFSVAELSVKKGQTVVFFNDDRTTHNVTVSGDGNGVSVNGGLQPPGADFRMPFSKPGTYAISCGIHPKMKMTIVVQ